MCFKVEMTLKQLFYFTDNWELQKDVWRVGISNNQLFMNSDICHMWYVSINILF